MGIKYIGAPGLPAPRPPLAPVPPGVPVQPWSALWPPQPWPPVALERSMAPPAPLAPLHGPGYPPWLPQLHPLQHTSGYLDHYPLLSGLFE